jgi:Uncharacterized conserved protein
MKRKRFDREGWHGILRKHYHQCVIDSAEIKFHGIAGVVYFDEVSRATFWGKRKVVDVKMKWLHIMPYNENYIITAMLDENSNVVLWYIDIIAGHGYADDGVAWFDDLYLDLVLYPNGKYKIQDMDELREALRTKDITKAQYDTALAAMSKLRCTVTRDIPAFTAYCMDVLRAAEGRT